MYLYCANSSSQGNAFALVSNKETLLIECGRPLRDIKKAAQYPQNIVGCIVSHRHGDHAKYAKDYIKNGIMIYSNSDCVEMVRGKLTTEQLPYAVTLERGRTYSIGEFRVCPVNVDHDVPDYGYIIYHKEMGSLFFATDCFNVPVEIKHINHFLIEANYKDDILKANLSSGLIDRKQYDRLMTSHFSLDNCVEYIKGCGTEQTNNIILCHLSSRNSHADDFKDKMINSFGIPTYIAEPNMCIELNKDL
jgi:phosphoribosyl 1,2-cyclic phosphodiesterase